MTGMLIATTVGAGIFTLPWIFRSVGWGSAIVLLLALGGLVCFAERSYWKTLDAVGERHRLVGLAYAKLGKEWGLLAFLGVVGGMLFTLVVYLILASRFMAVIFPVHGASALLIFWALAVIPTTFGLRRFATAENIGIVLKCALIAFVFLAASEPLALFRTVPAFAGNPLAAFGAILFALSGWNAIEPMYELWRGGERRARPSSVLLIGGALVILLYILFSAGIIGSLAGGSSLSPDALSGLVGWPAWKLGVLAALGLVALWTAYLPTSLEVEHALAKDLHWNRTLGFALASLLPLFVVLSGFTNVIMAVSFAGAIFAGIQYVIIFALAEKVLRPGRAAAWAMRTAAAVFGLAALYEVAVFVVH